MKDDQQKDLPVNRAEEDDRSELVIGEYIDRQQDAGKRRRRVLRLVCVIVGIVMLIAVLAVGAIYFFKIESITVEGNTVYTTERIVGCCGADIGQNIFLVRAEDVAKQLGRELPFIYSVRLERKLPGTLNLVVYEEKPRFYFQYESDFVVLSREMKVLDITSNSDYFYETYPTVLRVEMPEVSYAVAGEIIRFRDEANSTALKKVLDTLENCSIGEKINSVDFRNRFDVKLNYEQGRFTILFGNVSDAEIKMEFARQIVASFREDATGTICVDDIKGGYAIVDDSQKLIK